MTENTTKKSNNADRLTKCEEFFFEADLSKIPIFCGDDRRADEKYVHIFGGIANTAYTLEVLQEAGEAGSICIPLDEAVVSIASIVKNQGIDAGVHSDDSAESGKTIDCSRVDGKIGCGYLQLRQSISQLIGERQEEIVGTLINQDPRLYKNHLAQQKAREFILAHARLAERDIFSTGRKVAIAAVGAGVSQNIVYGGHTASFGVVNKQSNTSLDTTMALVRGNPAYDHDTWAAIQIYESIKNSGGYKFDERSYEIANDVDTVGTMLALGVANIRVRT